MLARLYQLPPYERRQSHELYSAADVRVTVIQSEDQIGREREYDDALANNQRHVAYAHKLETRLI